MPAIYSNARYSADGKSPTYGDLSTSVVLTVTDLPPNGSDDRVRPGVLFVSWDVGAKAWGEVRLVRTTNRVIDRCDEGEVVLEAGPEVNLFVDRKAVPGTWSFYYLFGFSKTSDIWMLIGSARALTPADHGWSERLPALIPGPALRGERDESNDSDLLGFLSAPATILDEVKSLALGLEDLWDPDSCPALLLPLLAETLGVPRDVIACSSTDALRRMSALAVPLAWSDPTPANLARWATAISGYPCDVDVVNHMLDASDASAEWGSVGRWVADTGTVAAVEHMAGGLPETYPWLMDGWFLRLTPSGGAGSMSCKGGDDAVPEWHDAVPVPRWGKKVRIGAYLEAASGVVATLTVTAFDEDMVSLGTLGGANGLLKVTGNGTGWNWHAGDYVALPVVGSRPTRYLLPKVTMTGTSPLGVDAITLDIAKSENSDYA